MENIKLYCIKDKKSTFAFPFGMANDNVALRGFEEAINNSKNELNKHPYDYELYYLGEFNNETGEIKSDVAYMCSGKDYYKEMKNDDIIQRLQEILLASGQHNSTNISENN